MKRLINELFIDSNEGPSLLTSGKEGCKETEGAVKVFISPLVLIKLDGCLLALVLVALADLDALEEVGFKVVGGLITVYTVTLHCHQTSMLNYFLRRHGHGVKFVSVL